ncbi:MAG: kinase [Pseudonocardia sp.]|nr:kinase [Pseudonocardia sp.]
MPRHRRRFDDDEPVRPNTRADRTAFDPHLRLTETPPTDLDGRAGTDIDTPPEGDRWSTWAAAEHGPVPRPSWVVTAHAAVDTELGVLKTGKEADVHLLGRGVPGTDEHVLLAAKRYRSAEHRMFHRDAGYTEGRRVRRSRETRAMASRTAFGRQLLAGQWARAEFDALGTLWAAGAPVPYPVQLHGTELLLEFVGTDDGEAAPRLAQLRPGRDELRDLWDQLREALLALARRGWAHGDLSAYNLLVDDGRLVLIDLPQVVDVVGNPRGPEFLARDVCRITEWFSARGLPGPGAAEVLLADLRAEAGIGA